MADKDMTPDNTNPAADGSAKAPGAQPPNPDLMTSSGGSWTGSDKTVAGMPSKPADDWKGADRTVAGPAAPGQPWSGADATAPTAQVAGESDWQGSERTVSTPAGAPAGGGEDWAGGEQTILDGAKPAARPHETPSRGSGTGSGSGAKSGGSRSTGTPNTLNRGAKTTTGFDEAWHMQGRLGPFTGQTWGDWELGGILGEGGMGAVYRGRQISLKRRVAIKVLPPALAADQRLLQRFQLEARTSSMLSSPNLVQVFAAGEWAGNHFFAMEFIEGTDLHHVIRSRQDEAKPFAPEEAADIVMQAAKGLCEAARHSLVHRDIKPSNLMITNTGLVKIADFGIVKVLGESQLTITGQAVGTPSYVSPEQGRGTEVDQRSDLYSLGVVFYEMLCGKKPFEAVTPNALIYKHCYAEPELPRTLNPAIGEDYQAVVLKLLQKKPENRYQTPDELVQDLEQIRAGNQLRLAMAGKLGTGAAEAQRENLSWVQRNVLPLAAGLVAAALLAGVGGYSYWRYDQTQIARKDKERQQASDLYRALLVLDDPRPIPDGAEDKVETYARLDGADLARVEAWRNKLTKAKDLRMRLARLDADLVAPAVRTEAATDLEAYAGLVGVEDPQGVAWRERLAGLNRVEEGLRERLGAIDQMQTLSQVQRDAIAPSLEQLKAISGPEDRLVQRVSARLADFDHRRDGYLQRLAALDKPGVTISEKQRADLQYDHAALTAMLGDGDPRLQRWSVALTASGEQVRKLRERLHRLDGVDLPPVSMQLELGRDIAALQELVSDTDPDLRSWKAKIAAAQAEAAALRQRLAHLDRTTTIPPAEWTEDERILGLAAALVGDADQDVQRWRGRLAQSKTRVGRLTDGLAHLDRPEPVTISEQASLAAALEELESLQAIDAERARIVRRRLDQEKLDVAGRRTRLAILDTVAPVPDGVRADLATLRAQTETGDKDVARWSARLGLIDAELTALSALDRPEPPPADAEARMARLESMVGTEDPTLQRWRSKVARIASLRPRLIALGEPGPVPADAQSVLDGWAALSGQGDGQWKRASDRVTAVRESAAELTALQERPAMGEGELERAHELIAVLTPLLGASEPGLLRLVARQRHHDGPWAPSWATDSGRDRFGPWAEIRAGQLPPIRLRWVAAGGMRLGSPGSESGRDADEFQISVRLTRAYWIAEDETSQAIWESVMAGNPSRDRGESRPVERISWDDAQVFLRKLGERVGNGFSPRLPTEAEWERACRGGSDQRPPVAEGFTRDLDAAAWYQANAGVASKEIRRRAPNPIGLFDILGNVSEWCQDRYGAYATGSAEDPIGQDGDLRVARGGSWADPAQALRPANRIAVRPTTRSALLGMRIACPADGDLAVWRPVATKTATAQDTGSKP